MKDKKSKSELKILNYSPGSGINVRLRGKKLAKGKISLYLDYYTGYSRNDDDALKTSRKIEYLKIYLFENPKTPEERQKNNENLELAQNIRNKRESERLHNPEGFISPQKKKINFFDYCQNYSNSYDKKDIRMITGTIAMFKDFSKETFLLPKQIDERMILGYRDYLLGKLNGESPNSYFRRFKKILKQAQKDGLFTKSPAEGITCGRDSVGISKAILMPDEIIKLSQTECGNSETKRAFLFSLNTGLRFVDIVDLKYKHIQNGRIVKDQQKTGTKVYIDLNGNALKLLGEMKKPEENIFTLPSLTGCLKTIKTWATNAGIQKNVTWHSARHSFATILLMNNNNIKTVSGLLGHSKLDHTQKYTHIVDELKKKAVDGLPLI